MRLCPFSLKIVKVYANKFTSSWCIFSEEKKSYIFKTQIRKSLIGAFAKFFLKKTLNFNCTSKKLYLKVFLKKLKSF